MVTRSLLGLIGTLAVVATLWLTLLSGGGHTPVLTPSGTTTSSGAVSGAPTAGGYGSAIDAARGAVGQADQSAQRAAGPVPGAP
jgi:hypothetical protein